MPRQKCADIDNRLKALLDILVAHQVIEDDRLVVSVKGTWVAPGSGDACRVKIENAWIEDEETKTAPSGQLNAVECR